METETTGARLLLTSFLPSFLLFTISSSPMSPLDFLYWSAAVDDGLSERTANICSFILGQRSNRCLNNFNCPGVASVCLLILMTHRDLLPSANQAHQMETICMTDIG